MNLFKASDIRYDHLKVRLVAIKSIPKIEIADEELGSVEENGYFEVRNWVADELVKDGFARLVNEGERLNLTELHKAQVKESMQPARRLSVLPENFYPKLRRMLRELHEKSAFSKESQADLKKATDFALDIITSRLNKILILSSARDRDENLIKNLTDEEKVLYEKLYKTVNKWRNLALKY